MSAQLPLSQIYDHNLNILMGAGASFGLLPTLSLAMKKDAEKSWSLEDLGTHFENENDQRRYKALFMHYYRSCIHPAQELHLAKIQADPAKVVVLENYGRFIETILKLLQRRKGLDRRCNVFTTNYDGCLPLAADEILRGGHIDFVINDGTRGFSKRFLQARNFNTYYCQTGIFERHQSSLPQINLINLHGSIFWQKDGSSILVDFNSDKHRLKADWAKLDAFSAHLNDPASDDTAIPDTSFQDSELDEFWAGYKELPIVNPSKWKFHETVFEEHYYQMLRLMSYELEKPNAILVTFGFSFRDEHILNLVKRSLANPQLQVFICCLDNSSREEMRSRFLGDANVQCITPSSAGKLDFTAFNDEVFTLSPAVAAEAVANAPLGALDDESV